MSSRSLLESVRLAWGVAVRERVAIDLKNSLIIEPLRELRALVLLQDINEAAKKAILRHFPYGLCVVTVAHDGEDHGMTANWITQAAFEPPMVAVAIENTSKTIGMVRESHHFAINLLLTGQRDLAGKLGRNSDQAPHKLKGLKTKPAPVSGVPVLVESLGWVECRVVATLPAGDHTLVLGEVVGAGVEHEGEPLTLAEAGFKYSG